jgi:hypothetical protein
MLELYWRGRWDEALELGNAFPSEEDDGRAALQQVDVLLIRAKLSLARESAEHALEDGEKALELARGVGAPQILFPRLAFQAHALAAAGHADAAAACADELLSLWLDEGQGASLASFWLPDLTYALADLGRSGELVDAARRARTPTRWLEAALYAGEGDWQKAAGLLAQIGSLPDEAGARLRAAADLAAADRTAEAERELLLANAFYRRVGALASVAGAT